MSLDYFVTHKKTSDYLVIFLLNFEQFRHVDVM